MKRKIASHDGWQRIFESRFNMTQLETPAFAGVVTRFDMIKVREPLFVNYNTERLCIADTGFTWLQHFPRNANYVVSSIFDANGNLVQHYIDVILEQGLDERRIPWYLDLYLDVIVTCSGQVMLKDVHELENAFETREITKAQFDFAHVTASSLISRIQFGNFGFLELAVQHHKHLEF
jgi:uncharacterized protein